MGRVAETHGTCAFTKCRHKATDAVSVVCLQIPELAARVNVCDSHAEALNEHYATIYLEFQKP